MPFKIVRTLEKGKYSHWIVPATWESNNIVKWPKRNISKLVKCDDYLPDPDWRQIKCRVKRNNIPTYKDAERELENLLCVTDTDEEQINDKMTKSNKQEVNLNALVEQLTTNQYEPLMISVPNEPNASSSKFTTSDQQQVYNQYNSPVISVPNESSESSSQIILTSDNQILGIPPNTYCVLAENQDHFIDKSQENSDLKKILDVLENHDKKMDSILENQKKIMHKMACISVQVDNMQLQLGNCNEEDVVPLGTSKNQVENLRFSFSPITTVEDLNKINDLLSDKTARKQLKQTFSVICSGGKGINCAYRLIDIMFSRDFLCQCSWSGSSRSDGVKISLKCYKNVVSFFWEMIFSWDQTFTLQKNELFFKSILKNANKRKNAKQERSSTARKRAKIENNKSSSEPYNNENSAGNIEQDANETENNNYVAFVATAENNVENQPRHIPGIKMIP
ncbi:uncharacterized protein LOC110384383 [Helicoverpa armigera]|uniref:uncharacterized protein LOC110384383 n=1 Tax=Helicoverpa armigera TaxID=29058 RepID=UPI003083DDDF